MGGLDKQIKELVEAIVLPVTHKDKFKALGIRPPKGAPAPARGPPLRLKAEQPGPASCLRSRRTAGSTVGSHCSLGCDPPLAVVSAAAWRWICAPRPQTSGLADQHAGLAPNLKYPSSEYLLPTMPAGVLLYGPPGTGKTLLARACAAQTNATFFKLAGPQLVQMFIGDGAKLVRLQDASLVRFLC